MHADHRSASHTTLLAASLGVAACSNPGAIVGSSSGTTSNAAETSSSQSISSADESLGPPSFREDMYPEPPLPPLPWECVGDESCFGLDLLIVVDNSGTMAQEQRNVAANFAKIVEKLENLTDVNGGPVSMHVNIMVTTTDVGHPLCTPLQKPDYEPRRGAPVYDGCNARLERFTGLGPDPEIVADACTTACPVDITPTDQFIHFDSEGSNVPLGTVAEALSCIGPQGIDGCEYESPLEAMLRAIDPQACWNAPDREGCADDPEWGKFDEPFLREDTTLAIMLITDEAECSVEDPAGFAYFTDPEYDQYWEVAPDSGVPEVSSAVCWNAGVTCNGPDPGGAYTDCVSTDNGVLQPTERYRDDLDQLRRVAGRPVVMLGVFGVPEVTEHATEPPFEPTVGGAVDLAYREWTEADLTPAELVAGITVEDKVWEFGNIAPGCANERGLAIAPTRAQEVCESLNIADDPATPDIDERWTSCCIESICDDDYSDAIRCLTVAQVPGPLFPG